MDQPVNGEISGPVGSPAPPPAALRASTLATAIARRAPAAPEVIALSVPYATQVALLDGILHGLRGSDWEARAARHGTIRGVITHLTASDQTVATAAGVTVIGDGWRAGASSLLHGLSGADRALLGRQVPLVGRKPVERPLREAMIQRLFETWTHTDDVLAALGRPPQPPPPEHLRMIAGFIAALLPVALPGMRPARLVLSGVGELAVQPGEPEVVITADAVDFCRYVAGRVPELLHSVEGDDQAARAILQVAATLGCD
ncbi:hypothetical protein J5X84_07355 [Streptosporangiaceae bacterium NEAU-GS5]|nr:hypothetical protein [Streptosporangiaceae bacterium NEAU-GS5]